MNRFDVIVIGSGPAGLAAAVAAASDKRVLLLDSAPRPGGQYWRHRAGHEPKALRPFLNALQGVDYRPNSSVWLVEPGFTVHTPRDSYTADRIVIATGAYDRSFPFPGWDLPGVVTAGGAQALLKGQGVPIGRTAVVSGAGPFLLPVAAGLARAGVRVAGVFEAGRPLAYLRHRGAFAKSFEALGYGLSLARHRIPYFTGHRVVAAHGERRLEAVTVNTRVIECDALAVGYGFTPQIELAVTLGCRTTLDDDGSLVVAETRQATTTPGVYVAGEVTGVGGAALALVEGRLAGLAAAGRPLPVRLLRRRESLRSFASAMAAIHRVEPGVHDDVVVCRCESVTSGAIMRAGEELGVVDGRGAKLMTRAGMGWCQGRVCGHAVAYLVAAAHGREVTQADLLAFANRPIAQPLTLRDLAGPPDR